MKKFIAILAVIALMTAMMIAVSAAGEASIVVKNVDATAGAEVNVEVIASTAGIANGKFKLVYNHDVLTVKKIVAGPGSMVIPNGDTVSFASAFGLEANNVMFTVTFEVAATAKCGDHSVSVDVVDLYDTEYNEINANVTAGAVSMDHNWVKSGETAGTCVTPGTIDYTCSICGETKSEEGSIGSHNLVHTPAVAPTCTEDGCGEYWYCATCDCYFADAEGKQNTHPRWLWIGATGHNYVLTSETAGTCVELGTKTYTCTVCGDSYTEDGVIGSHNLVHTPAVAPTCTEDGCGEYWYCATCDCYFADAEGKQNTHPRWLWIGATGHNYVLTSETAGSCIELGSKTYTCTVCGDSYTEDGVIGSHNLKHTAKVEPTCTENGMNEYWYCDVCDCHFADAEGKYNVAYKSLTIPALGHDYVATTVTGSCIEPGKTVYTCSVCGDTYEVEGAIGAHNLKHTAKVEPTCTENGMNEYWYCDVCDCHFADAEGKYNVAYLSLTIPALGHDFVEEFSSDENGHWHKCSRCDAISEIEAHTMEDVIITEAGKYTEGLKIQVCSVCGWTNNEDIIIPPTGDTSNVLVAVIGAFSSVAAAAYVTNKRK